MASKKYRHNHSYIYNHTTSFDDQFHMTNIENPNNFEFQESDVWNSSPVSSQEIKKTIIPSSARSSSKKMAARKMDKSGRTTVTPCCSSSLPVKIPDWSKIYKDHHQHSFRNHGFDDLHEADHVDFDDDHGDDQGGIRVPPHEYLARQRGASFSVHEGVGRTLKGRDLRQVRNAIWKKVGFED